MAQELQRLNILEINTSLGYGGAQRTMITFCKYLNRSRFTVSAVSYGDGGPREQDLADLQVSYVVAHFSIPKILAFAKEKSIHIFHMHRSGNYHTFEFELIKALRTSFPDSLIIETNVFGFFDRKSDPYIDCHLLKSKMMLNERFVPAAGAFDFSRMKVLYNPVDHNHFEQIAVTTDDIQKYKKQHGIASEDFVIGRLGRPHISKWSDLILNMLPHLIRIVPNTKCIIQAAPASRIRKIKNSSLSHSIIFLDETIDEKQIALFYSALDVYVHASKIGESFGMTLAEAGVFKKPVVVNSTPHKDNNQLELVDHMETGIIANHPETFARAVAYLYNQPAERIKMGENGYKKVTKEYDAGVITQQLEKICVEAALKRKYTLAPEVYTPYRSVVSTPSEDTIIAYIRGYQTRCAQEYGQLSLLEKCAALLRMPYRYIVKLQDFIEAKRKK